MKYRKSPWSKEQNWECGTVRGALPSRVTEPDSSWRFSLQVLLPSWHRSSASKSEAREKLHPQLPCSLVAKLKGKLNLNLTSPTKESQAEESHPHGLHLPSISSVVGEGNHPSDIGLSQGVGILGTEQMGCRGHGLYSVFPHPKSL